jgi:hypothetical protein
MWKLLSVSTIAALLVSTISGLVPLKYVPHDHLLIGFVTAEQLIEHEKEESLAMQNPAEAQTYPSGPTRATITSTGGHIISVAPVPGGLLSALHVEIAPQFVLRLFVPLIYGSMSILGVLPQTIALPSPDPPPRPINAPI